jgi:hypothetical protein
VITHSKGGVAEDSSLLERNAVATCKIGTDVSEDRCAFNFRVKQYKKTDLDWLTFEVGTYRLARNVGKKPQTYATLNPKTAQISHNTEPFIVCSGSKLRVVDGH